MCKKLNINFNILKPDHEKCARYFFMVLFMYFVVILWITD